MDCGISGFKNSSWSVMAQNNGLGNDRFFPQLFTSMPTLNEAASYIAETTSCITSYFPSFTDENTRADGVRNEHEMLPLASEQKIESPSRGHFFSNRTQDSHTVLSASTIFTSNAPQSYADRRMGGTYVSSESFIASAQSTSESIGLTGISLFRGLVERARRTVRGSADDIGWLQRDPDMPPVKDGTERFTEILDSIRHGVHRLPKTMNYLLVPGLFSNHGPLYFTSTKEYFTKMGLECNIAKIHSEASVEENAGVLKAYIEEIYRGSKKRVMLLGHSKGGVDAAATLSMYWPELEDKVAGLVLAQSPYGGSPIASDILRPGPLGDYFSARKVLEFLICKVIKGDLQALEDLTYEKRRQFVKKYPLPKELPVVSFHTQANLSPSGLATLSHVAHAELGQATKLPVMMPLGAAMAASAQLLQVRYGAKSDGLVTCCDAEVPGSVVVRPNRKLDHAWMVYSPSNDDPSEANASQVCEALLQLLIEVGDKKKQGFERRMNDDLVFICP